MIFEVKSDKCSRIMFLEFSGGFDINKRFLKAKWAISRTGDVLPLKLLIKHQHFSELKFGKRLMLHVGTLGNGPFDHFFFNSYNK